MALRLECLPGKEFYHENKRWTDSLPLAVIRLEKIHSRNEMAYPVFASPSSMFLTRDPGGAPSAVRHVGWRRGDQLQ